MSTSTQAIRNATNLNQLLVSLRAYEDAIQSEDPLPVETMLMNGGVDICELPTFGGNQPSDTSGVWSWDQDHLLVGEGRFSEWRIVERADWQ